MTVKKTKKSGLGIGQEIVPYKPPYAYPPIQDGMTTKETIQYSLAGIIVVGGAVIIGRKFIKKEVTGKEQQKTLEDGSIATYAKQIKMAFDNDGYSWWGSNVSALRDVLRQIPDKASFDRVVKSYQRLYNNPMLGDMQKALKSSEYDEMIAIVSAKPDRYNSQTGLSVTNKQLQEWSKRLKAAFDLTHGIFPGTDNDAIKAVFLEVPTQSVFEQVKQTYQTMYGNELLKDLKSKLFYWDYDPMMKLIFSKPNS